MKQGFFFLFLILALSARINLGYAQTETKSEKVASDEEDEDCDKSKFPDFKRNLRFTTSAIELSITHTVDSIAKRYFKDMQQDLPDSEKEAGYLDTLILNSTSHFFTDAGVEVFVFGYIVHSDHTDFEPGESSFFLVGAKKKGEILVMDIFHDIDGALTLQMLGFEYNSDKTAVTFWGKVDGLFLEEYGRFKLVISEKVRLCLYECKNEGLEIVPYNEK